MSITLIERVLEIYPKRMQFPFHSYITMKKIKRFLIIVMINNNLEKKLSHIYIWDNLLATRL